MDKCLLNDHPICKMENVLEVDGTEGRKTSQEAVFSTKDDDGTG